LACLGWEYGISRQPDLGHQVGVRALEELSNDLRPVRLRARSQVRALVAVAGPSDLDDYEFNRVDVEARLVGA